jgi:hypothetical protein
VGLDSSVYIEGVKMEFSISSFFQAFKQAPRPTVHELTPHRCEECDKVRDDFAPYSVEEVPDEVLNYHGDSIPLLSPKAFRYYLPAYVKFTCENQDSIAADGLLFNLSPNDPSSEFWAGRTDDFTPEEKEAIIDYLKYRRTWLGGNVDDEWILPALRYWDEPFKDIGYKKF